MDELRDSFQAEIPGGRNKMVNRLTNEEMGALLGAFSDIRKDVSIDVVQTRVFKICLIFSNIYVILFTIVYALMRENIFIASEPELLGESFLTVFNGKAMVMFWLMAGLNFALYFDIGFRTVCLCYIIYILNSSIDNGVLFLNMVSLSKTPYLSLFIFTVPLLAGAMAVMVFTHKSSTEEW